MSQNLKDEWVGVFIQTFQAEGIIYAKTEERCESTGHVKSIRDIRYCLQGKCVGRVGDRMMGDNDLDCHTRQFVLYPKGSESHWRILSREWRALTCILDGCKARLEEGKQKGKMAFLLVSLHVFISHSRWAMLRNWKRVVTMTMESKGKLKNYIGDKINLT